MDDLGIRPPTAPGGKGKTKGGFFSKIFKKSDEDVQEVRVTEEHMNEQFDIDDIRKQVGIEEAPKAEEMPEKSEVPSDHQEETPSVPESAPEKEFDSPPQQINMPEPLETGAPAPTLAPEAEMPAIDPEALANSEDDLAPQNIEEELTPPPRIDKEWLDNEAKTEHKADEPETSTQSDGSWSEAVNPAQASEDSEWSGTAEDLPEHSSPDENDFTNPMNSVEHESEDDLEDIKRLHDEIFVAEAPAPTEQKESSEEINSGELSHDWASDKSIAIDQADEPENTEEEVSEFVKPHHEPVEAVMAEISQKHKKLDDELAKVKEILETELPEWNLQKKEVTPENHFTLKNGQKLSSFRDLLEALSFIDDETYNHHVTEDRNDFAEWVEHILEEEKLAEKIRNKKAREELLKILRLHEEKVHKEQGKQRKSLDKEIERRKKKTKKIRELEKKLAKLAKELEAKSSDLRALRGTHGKELKEHIDAHIEDRIGDARTELHMRNTEVDGRALALDEQDMAIDQRHDELKDIEQSHKKEIANIEQQRSRFEAEMRDSHELIGEAEKIRAEKEEAIASRKEAKDALKEQKKLVNTALKAEKAAQLARKRAVKAQKKLAEDKKSFLEEKKTVTAQKKEFEKRSKILDKEETNAKKAVADMKAERKLFVKDRDELKAYKKRELSGLEERRKEVEGLIKEVESRTEEYREVVKKNESTLEKNQGILDEIERLRDDVKRREQDSEKQSMKAYLQSKLDETLTDGLTSSPMPDVDEVSNVKLYRMIDDCKKALDGNDIVKSRSLYNKLRTEFSTTKLSSHEKSVLYNSIRELYDDIHLAMLNQ